MPTITIVEFNGERHTIDAVSGVSLMENVVENSVPGIDADCGGACACGTCHCFIARDWQTASGEVTVMEAAMLGMRPDRSDDSRLSCQIDVTDDMDGMVIRLPEYQM